MSALIIIICICMFLLTFNLEDILLMIIVTCIVLYLNPDWLGEVQTYIKDTLWLKLS